MLVRFRDAEACDPQISHAWDSIWYNRLDASGGYADWILAGAGDPAETRGGLRSRMGLHTSIMLALFTDRRLPDDIPHPGDDGDPRGWWGDSLKIEGEPDVPMGSLLWTLERSTLNNETALLAKDYAEDALQTIIDQGAVSRFEIETRAEVQRGFLAIEVRAFDRGNRPIDAWSFDVLWQQVRNPAPMNFLAVA